MLFHNRNWRMLLSIISETRIVAADDGLFEPSDERWAVDVIDLSLPDNPCYLEIIDGKHQLLAYSNMTEFMDHYLPFTVISGLDRVEREKLFVVLNREQTKVPPYLLWDLYTYSNTSTKSQKGGK